ncbi:MAG: CHAT domain-containing protein [Paracoccaceae bacterium]
MSQPPSTFTDDLAVALYDEVTGRRNQGGLTRDVIDSLHAKCSDASGGTIDLPGADTFHLRRLRRALATVFIDGGDTPRAAQMVEMSMPPDLRHPDPEVRDAAHGDEVTRWLNILGMVQGAEGHLDLARETFARAGEIYLRSEDQPTDLFLVLTNAVQSAYELGDDRRGARLMRHAERIGEAYPDDARLQFNLTLARLYRPIYAPDVDAFMHAVDASIAFTEGVNPDMPDAIRRFAALNYLHLGKPDLAEGILPAKPQGAYAQAEDALVRLQVARANGVASFDLVQNALMATCTLEADEHLWALRGTLCAAFGDLGHHGPALLMAVPFLHKIDTLRATLPRRRGIADHLRASILEALTPAQTALATNGFLEAASELAALRESLRHGLSIARNLYDDWAPNAEVREMARKAEALRLDVVGGAKAAQSYVDHILAARLHPPLSSAPMPSGYGPTLSLGVFQNGNEVLRLFSKDGETVREVLRASASDLAHLAQITLDKLRRGLDPKSEFGRLGEQLFDGVSDVILDADHIAISADGALRTLPFTAICLNGQPLGFDRAVSFRTGAAPRMVPPQLGRGSVCLALTHGGGAAPLKAVARERTALEALYGPASKALEQFNTQSLTAALKNRPKVLHIASHFDMVEGHLDGSTVRGEDGQPLPLTAIFNRDLDLSGTDLVFLAGCSSAGVNGTGSFAAHLNALGARAVVAALWPVDDAATATFSLAFHQAYHAGHTPDQSLAIAAHALRSSPDFNAPHHWAAFQCFCP